MLRTSFDLARLVRVAAIAGLMTLGPLAAAHCNSNLDSIIAIGRAVPRLARERLANDPGLAWEGPESLTGDRSALVVTERGADVLLVVDVDRVAREGAAKFSADALGVTAGADSEEGVWIETIADRLRALTFEESIAKNFDQTWSDAHARRAIDDLYRVRFFEAAREGRGARVPVVALISLRKPSVRRAPFEGLEREPSVRPVLGQIFRQLPKDPRATYVIWDVPGMKAPRERTRRAVNTASFDSAAPSWFEKQLTTTAPFKSNALATHVIYLPYLDVRTWRDTDEVEPRGLMYEVRLTLEAGAYFYRVVRETPASFTEISNVTADFNRRALRPATAINPRRRAWPVVHLPEIVLKTAAHESVNPAAIAFAIELLFERQPQVVADLGHLAPGKRLVVRRMDRTERGTPFVRSFVFHRGEDNEIYILAFVARQVPLGSAP